MKSLGNSQFQTAKLWALFGTLLLQPSIGAIQSSRVAGIISYTSDDGEHPLTEATVSLYSAANSDVKNVTISDSRGEFFISLAIGNYIVIVERNDRRLYQGLVSLREADEKLKISLSTSLRGSLTPDVRSDSGTSPLSCEDSVAFLVESKGVPKAILFDETVVNWLVTWRRVKARLLAGDGRECFDKHLKGQLIFLGQ